MIKRIALLVMALILSLNVSILAAEAGSGVVSGQVTNGTEGSGPVAEQDITLKTYLDNAEAASETTKTDAEGYFVFTGLATDSDYSYYVTLTFQEAEYNSEWFGFSQEETTRTVDMTVYDSTTSDEAISVDWAYTVINVTQGSLQVMEYYLFYNDSDRTYIGLKRDAAKNRQTLKFSLPDGATGLKPAGDLMECCIFASDDGFIDSMPVFPGYRDISYSYSIGFSSGKYTLTRRMNYPIMLYDLLVQDVGVVVTSNQLASDEPIDMGGTLFNHLSSQELTSGDMLVVNISGLSQAGGQRTVMWVVLALGLLTLGFGISLFLRKKRLQPVSPAASLEQRRQGLLVELAKLDDDFGVGKLSEERYRRLRRKKKAQLVELVKRSKVESGNS